MIKSKNAADHDGTTGAHGGNMVPHPGEDATSMTGSAFGFGFGGQRF
jgi:hypothetical protein